MTQFSTGNKAPYIGLVDRLFDNNHHTGFFLMELDPPMNPDFHDTHEKQVAYLLDELKITKANKAFAKQYDADQEAMIGLNPRHFFRKNPDHGFKVMSGILKNEQLQVITHENNMRGESLIIKGEYFILRNPNNEISGCLGIQTDATEETHQTEKLNIQSSLQHIGEEITLTASFEWEPKMKNPVFSEGIYRILGEEPGKEVGWADLLKQIEITERNEFNKVITRLVAGKIKSEIKTRLTVVQGTQKLRYIWCKITPIFDEFGTLTKVIGAVQDITDQTRQELLTDVLYNISRAAIDLSDFKSFYKTIQKEINRLVDADNMFVAFYIPEKDILDIQFVTGEPDKFKLVPADGTISKLVIKENCSLLLNNESLIDLDNQGKIRRIGKSSKTWLGVPLRHKNNPFGVLVVQNYERTDALDEEDQALLEFISIQLVTAIERMRDSEQIRVLSDSIQQSPVTVVITNIEGEIEFVNPKFEEVTGYSSKEVIGKTPHILNSNIHPDNFFKQMWTTIMAGDSWFGEIQNRRKGGDLYWEQMSISPVKNDKGDITNFVALKEDITDRKKMEKELYIAKEKAEESDRLKTAFLANMSHEVRTPMNGILGFSELLKDPDLSKNEIDQYLAMINSNGSQLMSIIDDIMTVANLEIKQLRLNWSNFNIDELLNHVRATMKIEQQAMSKDHLELIFPSQLSVTNYIRSDQSKIQQVLINLLKNALKFTHAGTVELSCIELPGKIIEFSVKDTGIGINREMQNIIFDRFRQVDGSNTRHFGGTGLGLAISKGLVELLGGKIKVESDIHKGSVFSFTFPYAKPV